jgi:hypothetical protein
VASNFQDFAHQPYGIVDAAQRCHAASLQGLPIHDRGGELEPAQCIQYGSRPGVEERMVLECLDRRLRSGERRAIEPEDFPAGGGGFLAAEEPIFDQSIANPSSSAVNCDGRPA